MTTARAVPARAVVPRATYRMQLHSAFRFEDATRLVPYLAALGISHLYISPPLKARKGSQHGYDVVDHGVLNPELGTREDFDAMVAALHGHAMGLVIDVVPNHMGVLDGDNAWWLDVLENGEASARAEFFDIDWHAADPALAGKVLLPVLGDQYGVVLEAGELKLGFDAARGYFTISYYAHQLPVDPSGYGALLREALRLAPSPALRNGGSAGATLARLAGEFDRLPARSTADPAARQRRQRDKTRLKAELRQAVYEMPALAGAIDAVVASLNGHVGARASFDALDALIEAQAYRLAHWRNAADEINYRRFFDINELAALRMERPEVFEATHRLVLELTASGAVDGLRIDHPDGMADPAGYFERLQQRHAEASGLATYVAGSGRDALPLYVAIEKIVAPHEQVPTEWAVHGTTGYRFANVVNGLLIDGDAKRHLDRAWRAFAPDEAEDFDDMAWRCRHVVMAGSLAGELTVLSAALLRLARADRRTRDFTLNVLRRALAEVVASFPVYRTYIVDKPSAQDRRFIEWAIGRARRRSLDADGGVFDFIRRVMLGKPLPRAPADLGERYRAFAQRLQQYTAPVAAKGVEDTALYRHQRLVSVNDVGGEPDAFGMSVAAFHAASLDRALNWPDTMLATSTHDAKRSEDVRARIDVISEMPAAWRLSVRRWSRLNRSHKRIVDGVRAPSRNDEYLLYQLLLGSLPHGAPGDAVSDEALADYASRIAAAMLKSVREAKVMTSWMNPNEAYESALEGFVHALLGRRERNLFLDDLQRSVEIVAWHGALNGLTLAVVKTLSPGVPDFYQGVEAIELALVDPDNRRPVDFDRRAALLAEAQALWQRDDRSAGLQDLLGRAVDGAAKFWVTWRALQLRREFGAGIARAEYLPLEVSGTHASHVVAFARRAGSRCVVVVGTRLSVAFGLAESPIGEAWGDTAIAWPANGDAAPSQWIDWISGQRVAATGALPLGEVLREFPVAALFGDANEGDERSR